jgi:hypothetical protein
MNTVVRGIFTSDALIHSVLTSRITAKVFFCVLWNSLLQTAVKPIPVAAPSKAYVCGHSLAAGGMDLSLVSVVFCR